MVAHLLPALGDAEVHHLQLLVSQAPGKVQPAYLSLAAVGSCPVRAALPHVPSFRAGSGGMQCKLEASCLPEAISSNLGLAALQLAWWQILSGSLQGILVEQRHVPFQSLDTRAQC